MAMVAVICAGLLTAAAAVPDGIGALREIEQQATAAATARDLDRLVGFYASDAVIVSAGRPPIRGRAAFLAHLEPLRRAVGFEARKTPQDIQVSGDLGYVRGVYSNRFTDPTTRRTETNAGTYVAIYRRQADGAWRIALDVTAPDPAPPPH